MYIRVDAACGSDYGECSGDIQISFKEMSIGDIIASMNEYDLHYHGLVKVDKDYAKKGTKHNALTIKLLKEQGWVHLESAKSRAERKTLENEIYILNESGDTWSTYNPKFKKIDLDPIDDNYLDRLADGAILVQKVSTQSVLTENDYKKLKTRIKKRKAKEAEKKAKLKAAAEKKKQKEIENAKKILAEAGEKV
jgi:hypothetical protein